MLYAEVAVDVPTIPDRTFSYSIPSIIELGPGHLVEIPFGSRKVIGIVFDIVPQAQVLETRDIFRLVYDTPVLDKSALKLARWISQHYLCSLFEASVPMLPPGVKIRRKIYLSVAANPSSTKSLSPYLSKVMQYISNKKKVDQNRLVGMFGQKAKIAIKKLLDNKILVSSYDQIGPSINRKYIEYASLPANIRQSSDIHYSQLRKRAPRQADLLTRLIHDENPLPLRDARNKYGHGAVAGLLTKNLIVKKSLAIDRDPLEGKTFPSPPTTNLTLTQQLVARKIRSALNSNAPSHRVFLIEGVTGSGKTEVYLDTVSHCIKLGKRTIVLVPEIALTHQTVERFASRFPSNVAVLHSGLTAGQRFDQWWKISRGEYAVVVGSRSAIFAPQPNLGLIIIDEEHEWTYKQHDTSPKYHARDVAIRRTSLCNGIVVLGSASPDIGSYHQAQRGIYGLLRLPERISVNSNSKIAQIQTSSLASVDVVDMRNELLEGNRHIFSRALVRELNNCLKNGTQAILFINRRGSASQLHCKNCGFCLKCRRCDVVMTYHLNQEKVICHYCAERHNPPSICPSCLTYKMAKYGLGTQSVVQAVQTIFPQTKILRWDRDTTTRKGKHEELLETFRSGVAQVLVGTQMIAKGFHFPNVTLVGIVSADVGLNIPDYRAGEKAFQLLYQVAGRAGRGSQKGKVIIQTYQLHNYAIESASLQNYQRFYTKEIAQRLEQGNPPFNKLIRLSYVHTNNAQAEGEALRRAEFLRLGRDSSGNTDLEVLGPTPAFPSRVRGRYRWQIILRGQDPSKLLNGLGQPKGWTVDVDPVGVG